MNAKKSNESVYTVDNAKVLRHHYKFYSCGTMGYMKEGDALVYVGVCNLVIDLKNVSVKTILKDRDGHMFVRTDSFKMYHSPKEYEQDVFIKPSDYETISLLQKADWGRLFDCGFKTITEAIDETSNREYCYLVVWTFENGEAVETPVVINAVEVAYEGKWHLNNGSLPEKFWESRKHAYDCNEYKVIDSDGEEFVEEGFQKRLSPTPEQWEIIKEFQALYEKAKNAGLKFFYDKTHCDSIKAINAMNVHEFGYEIDAFEGGDNIDLRDIWFADTNITIYDWWSDDGVNSAAMNPTPRQRKNWLKEHPENA